MTKTIPHYLRIHRASESSQSQDSLHVIDPVHHFWSAYSDVTGWRIDHRKSPAGESMELLPAVNSDALEVVEADSPSTVGKSAAMRLAQSASKLAEELQSNREAIRLQEAELATRALVLQAEADRAQVADRLEKVLADATAACRCDAAAMYMLDDDTQYLKTRSVFGLSPQRLEAPPRPLRGSRGDLEALVRGVVTIDDLTSDSTDAWNSPESFTSGICASLKSDDVPIGTMWLFGKQPQSFGVAEAAAARLAASHLSLELTCAAMGDLDAKRCSIGPIIDVANWQYDALPIGAKLADNWRVDGMIESPRAWASGWHCWDVLPDGTLMLAIAEATDTSPKGAMSAAVARAALAAHTGYRHTPSQLIQRVSDTLWQTSTDGQLVSMLYARVDPETGEGEIASAGSINALIASRYGYRPVADGGSYPLNTEIEPHYEAETFRITAGETLLAYTRGLVDDGANQTSLGELLRTTMELRDANPLAAVRRSLADAPLKHERGAVTLLRQ